jgi:predicted aminopeptidase
VHLGVGQARLLLSREPLTPERVAGLSSPEQAALAALRRALELGASLDLARTTSYDALVEADRGTVHVVVAAPANRLEPLTWWFPISGRVSYRGYFAKERAERFAAGLAEDGLDTYVRPAPLYSTLGFFDDPIPREALSWPEPDLVETILHELVHQTVFVPGDLEYDEALASFVAHHATAAFYASQPAQSAQVANRLADELAFARLLEGMRAELEQAYRGVDEPEAARARRAPIFARYQGEEFARETWRTERYLRFPELALSNAWVVANRTYVSLLPCFEAELAALGGDLAAFVRAHREDPGHRSGACAAEAPAE